ncbi:MAG: hypothetical protein LIP10_03730 [Clostridiales bacterium]|nr:hypothetical protein [Clostridiales bacterium]
MSTEDLEVSLEEANGEMRMIHEQMCNISDPFSEEYKELTKKWDFWHSRAKEIKAQIVEIEKFEREQENKNAEHKWKIVDVGVKVFLGVLGVGATFGSQVYASRKHKQEVEEGFKFEETGTFTSNTMRGIFGRTPGSKKM